MPEPGSFFEELKRRKVVRTAGAYAVVAWMVVEVASVVMPALRLPEWTLTFVVVLALLGFPLVLTLEWVFEVTSEGVRRTPGDGDRDELAGASEGRSFALRPVGLAGLVLVGAGVAAWQLWSGPGEEPAVADVPLAEASVAVLPFDVRGGEEIAYLREGMVDLLSTKLEGTESLRPLDPRVVLSFIRREEMDAGDPAVARAVSRRFGAGHYVQGSILEFEGRLQVKATLYRVDGDGRPVVEAAVEGEAGDLFGLVDQLAVEILTEGGGSVSRLTRLAALTTDSLSALKAYLEGETEYRAGQWDAAMSGYRRAVEVDSTFALAHYRLSSAASWAERGDVSGRALVRALTHVDRLAPHDRMLVEAQHAYRQGRHAEAGRLYREITDLYPEDVEAWYQLGEVMLHSGYLLGISLDEATVPFRRAVELDPEMYPALWHLAGLLPFSSDAAEFDATVERLLRLNPDEWFIGALHTLFRGDAEERAAVLGSVGSASVGDDVQAMMLGWFAPTPSMGVDILASVAVRSPGGDFSAVAGAFGAAGLAGQGRWSDARAAFDALARLDPALALEIEAYTAMVLPPVVPAEDLRSLRDRLEAWNGRGDDTPDGERGFSSPHFGMHPYLRDFLLGLTEARLGETAAARSRADVLASAEPPEELVNWVADLAAMVRAEAARADGDPERALVELAEAPMWRILELDERLSPLVGQYYGPFLRAQLLREAGRDREALRWYRAGITVHDARAATAHLHRARLLAASGEGQKAAELAETLRGWWSDADPAFQTLLESLPR